MNKHLHTIAAKIKHTGFIALWLIITIKTGIAQTKNIYRANSPDKKTFIEIRDNAGMLEYRVNYNQIDAISWSAMGLNINQVDIGRSASITGKTESRHKETFDWPLGESAKIENNYHELILHCQSSVLNFDIVSRVFNGSVAFRYRIQASDSKQLIRLKSEATEFNLPVSAKIYQYNKESVFTPMNVNEMNTCDLPATLVCQNNLYLSIGEAENRNYTKCQLLKGKKVNSMALTTFIDTTTRNHRVTAIHKDTAIQFTGSFETPWRTISMATSAIGLHDYSQLYLKLTEPLTKDAPTYVKPGKLIRAQINTQSGLDCIDFAVKHNFQYIMFDAGWYGAEFRTTSDPTKVVPQVDLPGVISHAREKNIGVILYVNYVGLRAKLDTILPLFKKWGVSGIKFGFVDGGTQNGLSWLDTAMRKVNDYGFILDVHDNYKPTGLSRRYPYNLTQEGIRGDENSPDAFHTTTLPYTRFIAGPADFTFCYPNSKNDFAKNLKVSMAQQLALTVIYFSPLQSILWYGQPNDYTNEEEIEFFKYVPTVWDESHYLAGEIGENISVARKKQNTWYMGSAAGFTDWHTTIKLNFLDKGKNYTATIYEDGNKGGINKRTVNVKKDDIFPIDIKAKGGQAIIIAPEKR